MELLYSILSFVLVQIFNIQNPFLGLIDIPLIFLNNVTGYMVGKKYEQAGMINMVQK